MCRHGRVSQLLSVTHFARCLLARQSEPSGYFCVCRQTTTLAVPVVVVRFCASVCFCPPPKNRQTRF